MATIEGFHKNELKEFDNFMLNEHRYVSIQTKGTYEIRRYSKPKESPIILFSNKNSDMVYFPESSYDFLIKYKQFKG